MIQTFLCLLIFFIAAEDKQSVRVKLEEKMNSGISGDLMIQQLEKGVKITGEIEGLKANSVHGFHIHEKADCSAADAKSAGGHFNPTTEKHGGPKQSKSHAGDLGNLKANEKGMIKVNIIDKELVLYPETSKLSVFNRSLVLHAKADDFKSQPSGNSGDRLACGIIVK